MKYFYWVNYNHDGGYGGTEMGVIGGPLTTGEQIVAMAGQIERNHGYPTGSVVVGPFQLLRTES